MADTPKEETNAPTLLDTIESIEAGGEVSPKKADVTKLIGEFKAYREKYKDADKTEKPKDLVVVGAAIKSLERAESDFDVDKNKIYGTKEAIGAEKKIDKWIKENGRTNFDGVETVLEFREQVQKAAKKTKKTGGKDKATPGQVVKEYSQQLLDETIDAVKGIDWPATKAQLTEKFEKSGKKLDKAWSGLWTNFKNAALNPECTAVKLDGDSKTKYTVPKGNEDKTTDSTNE